jgi:hypothetical protein
MDQNVLAYLFGGIGAATVGFAFLYKWSCEDRRDHDGAWAAAHLALALAVLLAAANAEHHSALFGTLIAFIFWHYVAFSVLGNLRFIGRPCPVWAAIAGAIGCGAIGLLIGLSPCAARCSSTCRRCRWSRSGPPSSCGASRSWDALCSSSCCSAR